MGSEWQLHTLGDFLSLEYGKPLDKKDRKVDGLYPAYGANGIKSRSDKYLCESKSIIIGRKGSAGELTLTEDRFWPLDVTYFVKFDAAKYDLTFVYYLLSLLNLPDLATGVKPGINRNRVYELQVKTPSLSEQQRIVAILDQAFADIEKARANVEKNLRNARELFDSYLNQVFSQRGEGWVERPLSEIADVEYGFTDKATEEGDFRYVRITDIDKNGELVSTDKKYIQSSTEARKFTLCEKDLLMARTGATFAKVLLYRDYEPSIFASYLIKISFKEDIDNEFYWFFSKTSLYWNQANELKSGAAQPHFNGTALKQVRLPYPLSRDEQTILIEKFKAILSETIKLENFYEKKLVSLEELKKSLLQKAFSGELTKTEGYAA